MVKLSILICSLPEPFYINRLRRLVDVLKPQVERFNGQIEYRIHDAGRRTMTTGKKRNELVAHCDGEYFDFIDADDLVVPTYCECIMKGLESNPDCVTFKGWMTTDGKDHRDWTIKLGSQYTERNRHYYRWPNHLVPMKKKLVEHIKFPDVSKQEDYIWSQQIHNAGLLKTEVHIDQQLYHYDFIDPKKRV